MTKEQEELKREATNLFSEISSARNTKRFEHMESFVNMFKPVYNQIVDSGRLVSTSTIVH